MYINMLRFFCNGINITYYEIFLNLWGPMFVYYQNFAGL